MLEFVQRYADQGVFRPEEITLLVRVFDNCWGQLVKSGVRYGSDRAMQVAREQLGKSIIEAARLGERDPHRLCEDAILCMAKSCRRNAR